MGGYGCCSSPIASRLNCRVIEFLNEQLKEADVLGVEIVRYVDGGHEILVPRVVGATAQARAVKEASSETTFLELLVTAPPEVREAVGPLDKFFAQRGVASGDSPKSRYWRPAHGAPARLWLGSNEFTLNIGKIGRDMSDLHAEIVRIIGRQTGEKVPSLPCAVLVDRWDDIESLVLRGLPFGALTPLLPGEVRPAGTVSNRRAGRLLKGLAHPVPIVES